MSVSYISKFSIVSDHLTGRYFQFMLTCPSYNTRQLNIANSICDFKSLSSIFQTIILFWTPLLYVPKSLGPETGFNRNWHIMAYVYITLIKFATTLPEALFICDIEPNQRFLFAFFRYKLLQKSVSVLIT